MHVAVLGAGSWGTALAMLLAEAGHSVALWGRDQEALASIGVSRQNARYLPGRTMPSAITTVAEAATAVRGRELVVFALPSGSVRQVAEQIAPALAAGATVVCASKGLDERSGATLDRVLADTLPGRPIVLLSGPTFAAEIAAGLPAAAVAASLDGAGSGVVQRAFAIDRFRVYTTEDVTGVAIGGALKNVIAIAAGCSDGLGFGHNARAALITRGLHEMSRLAVRLGGNALTLSGLAGLGDLVLTCTGELSRNRRVGLALGRGEPLRQIMASLGQVAEGITTARFGATLARELAVDMPITCGVAAVVQGERSPREAVADLLSREQGPERG